MTTFTGKAKYFAGNGLIINYPSDEEKNEYNLLKMAQAETESTDYDSISEINDTLGPIELTKEILKAAFKEAKLGLNLKESDSLAQLVLEYRENNSIKIFNRLPGPLKSKVNMIYKTNGKGIRSSNSIISREEIAKFIIDSIIDDGEFKAIMKQFDDEMNAYTSETSKEMIDIFSNAYDDIFNNIDEIRKEDPEKADRLESVKVAFEDATNFNKQIEYLNNDKPRNVRKYHRRAHAIIDTFNNLVNVGEIKIPNINELFDIIKLRLPQYNKDQINEFIILLCRSTMDLDFSVLSNIAYVYRLVDRIYKFKFITAGYEDEESTKVFNDISGVIELIQKRKEEGGNK